MSQGPRYIEREQDISKLRFKGTLFSLGAPRGLSVNPKEEASIAEGQAQKTRVWVSLMLVERVQMHLKPALSLDQYIPFAFLRCVVNRLFVTCKLNRPHWWRLSLFGRRGRAARSVIPDCLELWSIGDGGSRQPFPVSGAPACEKSQQIISQSRELGSDIGREVSFTPRIQLCLKEGFPLDYSVTWAHKVISIWDCSFPLVSLYRRNLNSSCSGSWCLVLLYPIGRCICHRTCIRGEDI